MNIYPDDIVIQGITISTQENLFPEKLRALEIKHLSVFEILNQMAVAVGINVYTGNFVFLFLEDQTKTLNQMPAKELEAMSIGKKDYIYPEEDVEFLNTIIDSIPSAPAATTKNQRETKIFG